MRELERVSRPQPPAPRVTVVGDGRLGPALAGALVAAGTPVSGPHGRGADPELLATGDVVILCVPDAAIASVASTVPAGPMVAHCSGATPLAALGAREAFSLHPLMTFAGGQDDSTRFAGAGAAVAGTTPRALSVARQLAARLGLRSFEVPEARRAAYHAAASMASNFLISLEAAAERLAAAAGCEREHLVPLVRATVENWAAVGAQRALTGPLARGDEATVMRQREAVAAHEPALLGLFDALTETTRALSRVAVPAP